MFGKKKIEFLESLMETAKKDREMYALQAEKDREIILEQIKKSANSNSEEPAVKQGDERKAAYALNLCTVSVSQIIDYNDLAIMEQEYDNILNNLNLENFPKDDALLKILKQILDVISFFRIQDGEKKILEEQYKKKVKDAVWSAVPSPSVILAGGKAGWAGLAVSAISAVGTGYMNYRKERATIDDEKRQKDWELQKSAMEQFHALRRELFDTAWRLAETYKFKDSYRLSERQISQYNRILLEEQPDKRYERLKYVESNFEAYPPFWYNLGHAAAEVYYDKDNKNYSRELRDKFKKYALSAFDMFLELTDNDKKNSLLREDQLCAACALEKFALLSDEKEILVEEKIKLLQKAAKNSGNAFDTLQLCATSYLELGVNGDAIKLLRMLINEGYNAEMNAQLLSMLYISIPNNVYKDDHEILFKRGYDRYMFPWIQYTQDNSITSNHTYNFLEEQNKFLFDDYKELFGIYITQCQNIFNNIKCQQGDISKQLVEFLDGIKKDVETLFGDETFALQICNMIAEGMLKYEHDFCDEKARRENKDFNFENISASAIKEIVERIRWQATDIRSPREDNERLKKVACYMNNLLLFKTQTKILGGNAISKNRREEIKTSFGKLIEQSQKNQADQEFMNVIRKYENKLFIENGKKSKVNFITVNVSKIHFVKKKNISANKILAYLETNDDDLLFTIDGIYRYGCRESFARYNSGKINLIENKKLQIDNLTFEHEQVDIKMLYEMVEHLSVLAPQNMVANLQFVDLVGEFPENSFANGNISGMNYCTSV